MTKAARCKVSVGCRGGCVSRLHDDNDAASGTAGEKRMTRSRFLPVFVLLLAPALAAFGAPLEVAKDHQASVVRVNATNQGYDFFHPWSKRAPYSLRGLGTVLADGRVLVTGELVANSDYVELEKAGSGEKIAADVEVVDYEANLALLKPANDKFLDGVKPLDLQPAAVGDRLSVWQLESTGALLITSALLTTAEVSHYPIDGAYLTYRLTASLQYRDGSFTIPVIKDGKLAGLMMRYDSRTQSLDAIPAAVIEHFLKDAANGAKYLGFPRAGLLFAPMRDPQLRRYAGLAESETRGVYVTEVQKDGPAGKGGLKVGDVILEIGGKAVDQDGDYEDPQYGKISIIHIISTASYDGDALKLKVFRGGKETELDMTLAHRSVDDYVIAPYTLDRAPQYFVLGGLVMQELSRQYLKEWGAEWMKKAPERFVYYDRYQNELFPAHDRKLVILSQVLPSATTVGYEMLSYLIVSKINGVSIKSIADVAKAVEKPLNGFHKIEFEQDPKVLYLDAGQVSAGNDALMKSYGLPALNRL